jgi:hypothetical protein
LNVGSCFIRAIRRISIAEAGAERAATEERKKMAKLSTKARKKLPADKFAGLDKSYPIPDKAHASNAKARATQMEDEGKLSASAKKKIDAKANKVLKKSTPKKK